MTLDASPGSESPRVRFSPTIELGHLLQALVMLIGFGGWALAGYYTIQKQLDQQAAEMALLRQQMKTDETAIGDVRENQRVANAATNTRLDKISDQIADLRALFAPLLRDGAARH